MKTTIKADLVVIGAGSGGLSVAAGAAQMGAEVVLVEKGEMGGDCLNYGCVPSKSLLAAAHTAQTVRSSGRFGINGHEPAIRFNEVHEHVHDVIASIAPHDSAERFENLGVHVVRAPARFTSRREIEAGEFRINAKRFVVATGSRAALPPIPGLADVAVMTNENLFDLDERPEHLVIIGGGPIGIEMAQAHRRLGSKVTLLEGLEILSKDDRDAVDVIRKRIIEEGVDLREKVTIRNVERAANAIATVIGGLMRSRRESSARIFWSPPGVSPMWPISIWMPPVFAFHRGGSKSMPGCARATNASSRLVMSSATTSLPISPATTPVSSSGMRYSSSPPR